MKLVKVLMCSLALWAVTGCKTITINDGRIPDAYLAKAKKYEGIYKGSFNGVRGELILRFEGSKPVLDYRNSTGTDILNGNCDSAFGHLTRVHITGKKTNPQLDGVDFNFNSGRCSLRIQGRSMYIDFKEKNGVTKLSLSLLRELRQRQHCQWYGGDSSRPPYQQCTTLQEPYYLSGTFTR